jgi:hypothetical protein
MIFKFSARGEDRWVGCTYRDAIAYVPSNPHWATITKLMRDLSKTGGVYEMDKKKEPELYKSYPAPFGNAYGVWKFLDAPSAFVKAIQARLAEDCADAIDKFEYEIVRDRYTKPEMFDTLEEFVTELDKLPTDSVDPRDEQIELLQAEVAKLQKELEAAKKND